MSAEDTVNKLLEGNKRFITGGALHPNQSSDRRVELAKGQKPIAAVLTCSDSRVSPEIIFDQGLGDLFVLRVAGNVVNDMFLGTLEYAVEVLNVNLIIVLGHSSCGAVSATVKGGTPPGHIGSLVDAIKPALDRLNQDVPDRVNVVAKENVKIVVEKLKSEGPLLGARFEKGDINVVGAFYDLNNGQVEVIG
jgi:carbonic anhydrase